MKILERPSRSRHVPGDAFWVGTNLHRYRLKKGMTQEALAAAAGISARRLRDVEDADADCNVKLETLSSLAMALGIETQMLFKRRKLPHDIDV